MNLYECHTHICLNGVNYKDSINLHKNGVNKEYVKSTLKKYQEKNILYIRDGGDKMGVCDYAKTIAIDYNITFATPSVAFYKKGNYGSIIGTSFENAKDFYEQLKKKKNIDFVKLVCSGIMEFYQYGKLSCDPLNYNLTREIIKISHCEGYNVMVHVNGNENIKNALDCGANTIEHGYYIDDECINLLKEKNAIWVPTITPVANLLEDDLFDNQKNIIKNIVDNHKIYIKKAFEKGANVALGSDSGSYRVGHVKGLFEEYKYLNNLNLENFESNILKSQEIIKFFFRRK